MENTKQTPVSAARHSLTRREVARRLGISTSSVRRLEWDRLHPEQDERGVWRFNPDELAGLEVSQRQAPEAGRREGDDARAVARRGRLAARVFRMFARHATLAQIVVGTKQPPEVIRELYRQWSTSLDEGEWERRQAQELYARV